MSIYCWILYIPASTNRPERDPYPLPPRVRPQGFKTVAEARNFLRVGSHVYT